MTPTPNKLITKLNRDFPEWQAWLIIIDAVVQESAQAQWQAYVPQLVPHHGPAPFLTGAVIAIEPKSLTRWLEKLLLLASAGAHSAMPALAQVDKRLLRHRAFDLLQASICQNGQALDELAPQLGAVAQPFRALADLAPLPLLHACRRRWSALIAESWEQGYCPICGAWPAFAEEQGIERSRRLRCGRCGAGWPFECLHCPYCGITEHQQLTSLVHASASDARRIDACKQCGNYLKTLAVLQGCAAETVLLEDLNTVALDIAALDAGYRRLAAPGYDPAVRVGSTKAQCFGRST